MLLCHAMFLLFSFMELSIKATLNDSCTLNMRGQYFLITVPNDVIMISYIALK